MIENDEQLQLTVEQLGRMYQAVAAMRHDILPVNPQKYAVFSEGVLDQIRELQAQIDAYLGLQSQDHETTKGMQTTATLRETPPAYPPQQPNDKQPD